MRPLYPDNVQSHWGAAEHEFLCSAELNHIRGMRGFGFDPLAQPLYWEGLVARMLGGETTAHRSEHDIEVEIGGTVRFAEVKFSQGHHCHFSPIRGRDKSRQQFKWAKPRGKGGKDRVDGVILVGRAISGLVYSWVVPLDAIAPRCASISVACPEDRSTDGWRWDRYAVPFDAILPAFARVAAGIVPPAKVSPAEQRRRRVAEVAGQMAFAVECATGRKVAR